MFDSLWSCDGADPISPPDPKIMPPECLRDELCDMALVEFTGISFEDTRIMVVVREVQKRLKSGELPVDWRDDIGYQGIIENLRSRLRAGISTEEIGPNKNTPAAD